MDIKGGIEKFTAATIGDWQTPTAPVTFAEMTNTPTGKDYTSVKADGTSVIGIIVICIFLWMALRGRK
jgi:hypothetical protein